MSATFASTARPSTAAIAWATKDEIFVEIPTKAGPPYICRYRKSMEGLCAALNILIENPEPAPRNIPKVHPAISQPVVTKSRAPWASEEQRAHVQALLKKHKIT